MVLDIFGDAVDFILGLMDLDLGVGTADGIYFAVLLLFFKNGPFPHAYSKLNKIQATLTSAAETWGDSSFSRNLLFSIMISKSISTFLPLAKL